MYEISTRREIIFGILGTAIGLVGMGFYLWFLFNFFGVYYGRIRAYFAKKLNIKIETGMEGDWAMQPTARGWLVDFLLSMVLAVLQIIVLVSCIMLPFGVFIITYFFLMKFLERLFLP